MQKFIASSLLLAGINAQSQAQEYPANNSLDEAAIAAEKPRHYKSVKPKTISKKNLKISPKIT